MQTSNNIYGLPTSRTNVDSHMLTNMEWGAFEYVMGNMSSSSGTTYTDQAAYNRGRLGDATSEVVTSASRGWYNSYARFTFRFPWFRRGGCYREESDVFYFYEENGASNNVYSSRATLSIAS